MKTVTASDMYAIRVQKSMVNRETYRDIYARVNERIKTHGTMGATDLVVKIPAYIPGRPVYDVSHAVRYVIEKLKLAGFEARGYTEPDTVYVSWKAPPPPPRKTKPDPFKDSFNPSTPAPPPAPLVTTPSETAKRLDLLRMKLKSLTK